MTSGENFNLQFPVGVVGVTHDDGPAAAGVLGMSASQSADPGSVGVLALGPRSIGLQAVGAQFGADALATGADGIGVRARANAQGGIGLRTEGPSGGTALEVDGAARFGGPAAPIQGYGATGVHIDPSGSFDQALLVTPSDGIGLFAEASGSGATAIWARGLGEGVALRSTGLSALEGTVTVAGRLELQPQTNSNTTPAAPLYVHSGNGNGAEVETINGTALGAHVVDGGSGLAIFATGSSSFNGQVFVSGDVTARSLAGPSLGPPAFHSCGTRIIRKGRRQVNVPWPNLPADAVVLAVLQQPAGIGRWVQFVRRFRRRFVIRLNLPAAVDAQVAYFVMRSA
jgi:hypothetical protein